MSKHSKLPWHTRHGRFIENEKYSLASLAIVPVNAMSQDSIDQGLADAAFIVKAVNNHDQLLEALKEMKRQAVEAAEHDFMGDDYHEAILQAQIIIDITENNNG